MKLVIRTRRADCNGDNQFNTVDMFEHVPVELDHTVAGWQGQGSGMSRTDYQNLFDLLMGSAKNVQSFEVFLAE